MPYRHNTIIFNFTTQPTTNHTIQEKHSHLHQQLQDLLQHLFPFERSTMFLTTKYFTTPPTLLQKDRNTALQVFAVNNQLLNTYTQCINNSHINLCSFCPAHPHIVIHPSLAVLRQQHNVSQVQQLWLDPINVVSLCCAPL